MQDLLTAWQFLTTIPLAKSEVKSTEQFARSMLYFPLVGLVLGLLLAAAAYSAALKLPLGVVGGLVLVIEIMLSGGLHLDGFMDTMDGIFSGRPRERILEIMKDSRVGANAVIAVTGLLIFKYSLYVEIIRQHWWAVLIITPGLGRFTMGMGTALFPYARPEGMGKGFANYFSFRHLVVTALYTVAAAVLLLGLKGSLLFVGACIWAWVFGRFVSGRIGGLTGDVYGALNELSEVVVLLLAVML